MSDCGPHFVANCVTCLTAAGARSRIRETCGGWSVILIRLSQLSGINIGAVVGGKLAYRSATLIKNGTYYSGIGRMPNQHTHLT